MSIGLKIKTLRFTKDIKETELADAIGVTDDKIKFWEKDLNRPTNAILSKIADYFKIDIDYFFEDDAPAKAQPLIETKKDTHLQKKNDTANQPNKIENFKTQITAKKKEQQQVKADAAAEAANVVSAAENSEILKELKSLNTKFDEIIAILKNQPDLTKIKKVETTYSLENANALLKDGWILLELFKDEKGCLGYRLGAAF